ncbi:MAG: sigma-E processing peptidase SpoIIGA [Candidatus Ventricola sp.]
MLDTGMNAAMLLVAVRLAGGAIRPRRILAAALTGALLAQAVRELGLSRGQAAALWLPAAAGMMAIACGRSAARRPVRAGALLLCAAGLLGGVMLALCGATGSLMTAYALGGVCTLLIAANAVKARREAQAVRHARVVCRAYGVMAAFDAMIDSGNTLRDYLTRLPVIVLPEETGRRRLRLGDAPLRPIFADTAGGRQMMGVLTPQEIIVEADGRRRAVRAVVALSPGMREGAPALVPASLMEPDESQE